MKNCKKCGHDKPQYDFYKSSRNICKVCVLAAEKVTRAGRHAASAVPIAYAPGNEPLRGFGLRHLLYDYAELKPYDNRPGANDALALPSRMGNALHYRDGRVERLP